MPTLRAADLYCMTCTVGFSFKGSILQWGIMGQNTVRDFLIRFCFYLFHLTVLTGIFHFTRDDLATIAVQLLVEAC